MLIREATVDDWPAIYLFFAEIVAAGRTYAYPEALSADAAQRLWLEPPPAHVVVAVEDGAVLGSAKMGPNRPGRGGHIATGSFMVDPGCEGRGIGRTLGDYLLDWARRNEYRGVQFNAVVETNDRALRLWRSLGFDIVGTVPGAFRHADDGYVGLHVLFRDLG